MAARSDPPQPLAPRLSQLPGARPGRDPSRVIKRGPSRVPPEVVAATQRDRLFDGLARTVALKGYAAARVSDICQAAGVTRPAFYALFEGKDDAFLATYRHGIGVVLNLMESAYQQAVDWPAGIRAALRTLLGTLASVPAFARLAIVEVDAAGPATRRERDRMLRRFDQFFAAAPAQPGLPAAGELVGSIVGGIHSTIYRYVAQGRPAELPSLLPVLAYFALVPFLGPAEGARHGLADPGDDGIEPAPCLPKIG